jgi:hypothetical protein
MSSTSSDVPSLSEEELMTMFDKLRRKPKSTPTGNGDSSPLDLEDVRKEVPDVEDVLERAERLSTESETELRGCGCWG